MSSKPEKTLSQLEERPQTGFYGATISEIQSSMFRALLIASAISAFFMLIPNLPWLVGPFIGLVVYLPILFKLLKRISATRAGKPLYYHKHVVMTGSGPFAKNPFIQPRKAYQRERNTYAIKNRK